MSIRVQYERAMLRERFGNNAVEKLQKVLTRKNVVQQLPSIV